MTDPLGARWTVRVPLAPARLNFRVSKQLFRMRNLDRMRRGTEGVAPDGVATTEMAHPSGLMNEMDAFAPIIALAMLAVLLVALGVFLVELIIVVLIAAVVGGGRMLWGRWRCEVIAPSGAQTVVTAGSLEDARTKCAFIADSIARGRGANSFFVS